MSDTNTALKGMLIGIATVALPVAGFVAGRKAHDEPPRVDQAALSSSKVVEKPCPVCPPCASATVVAVASAAPPPVASASASVSAVQAAGPAPAPGEGLLVVECVPACVALTLDGKEMGPSPLTGQSLPPGKHRVFGKFASGSPKVGEAIVVAGQTARISLVPGSAGPRDEDGAPAKGGAGCDPPYWVQEDGSHLQKPACR